jgi:hypothetical protein
MMHSIFGALSWVSFALTMWAFVEIGCLRGTVGPNRYGVNPLLQAKQRGLTDRRTSQSQLSKLILNDGRLPKHKTKKRPMAKGHRANVEMQKFLSATCRRRSVPNSEQPHRRFHLI